jgi:hypothetical protein
MTDERIQCPSCGAEIPLSEVITSHIEQRVRHEQEQAAKQQIDELRADYEQRLAGERRAGEDRASEKLAVEMKSLREEAAERKRALDESAQREVALLREKRVLEEAKQKLDLELERRLAAEKAQIEKNVAERLGEEHRLESLAKDKQLEDQRKLIEELRRKSEQGSQQAQGEVAELDLEALLRGAFPQDEIEPVAKGRRGADVVQRVRAPSGRPCGAIVWERKQTKAWSDDWLQKLRDDQRELRADVAVIVSAVLPKDVRGFGLVDGVWISDLACTLGIATALRTQLLQVGFARAAAESRGTKQDLVWDYLTGPEFKQRVESVVEAFRAMQDELDNERRAIQLIWSKREKQIQRAFRGLAGLAGDVQGLGGASIPTIPALELPSGDGDGER